MCSSDLPRGNIHLGKMGVEGGKGILPLAVGNGDTVPIVRTDFHRHHNTIRNGGNRGMPDRNNVQGRVEIIFPVEGVHAVAKAAGNTALDWHGILAGKEWKLFSVPSVQAGKVKGLDKLDILLGKVKRRAGKFP